MALASQRSIARNILRNELKAHNYKHHNGRRLNEDQRQKLREDTGAPARKKQSVFGAMFRRKKAKEQAVRKTQAR